jgi:hypothetical protein
MSQSASPTSSPRPSARRATRGCAATSVAVTANESGSSRRTSPGATARVVTSPPAGPGATAQGGRPRDASQSRSAGAAAGADGAAAGAACGVGKRRLAEAPAAARRDSAGGTRPATPGAAEAQRGSGARGAGRRGGCSAVARETPAAARESASIPAANALRRRSTTHGAGAARETGSERSRRAVARGSDVA